MSVLPLNWPDKVDSPELLAWLQQSGIEKYIDATQINSIRDALNELYFSSNPDRIISLGTETIDGNEHTYEDYTWQLGGVQVNNIGNPSIIVIPSATLGFKRKDISVFTPAGTIERVAGTETDGEVVTSPDVPEGTLYYKSYDIDGDTIGVDPEPPAIDGSIYKNKIENTRWKSTQSGTDVVIPFQAAGQMHYSVVSSGLISVAGFSTANLTGPLYEGIDVLFENQTGNPITLKNMFGGISTPFKFNFGADLIVPNGGKLWMRLRNREFELIMKSWSEADTYPIKYWYQATGSGVLQTYGTNAIFASGTQSDVVGVVSYRKYLTTTALGNLAIVRENAFGRINSNRGFHYEMRFKLENTASASDWRGLFGFRTTGGPTNINPTDDAQPFLGIGTDSGDTNLFLISKLSGFPIVKVDTGILKSTTNVLLLEIKRLNGTNSNELTLKNLSTGDTVTTVFDNGDITTITNYVSNNTSAQAIGFSISRIRLNVSE